MMVVRSLVLLLALAGCDRVFGLTERSPDAPPPPDAVDAPPDRPEPQRCFGSGSLALCLVDPPPERLIAEIGTTLTLDTTPGAPTSRCAAYTDGEPDLCVVGVELLQVDGVLQGIGTRPLVLVASTVVISGSVSVASVASPMVTGAAAQPADCSVGLGAAAAAPGGGGAGGTFGGRGGNGGNGSGIANAGTSGAVQAAPARLRGGCQGRAGAGTAGASGRGGGAVAIFATSLTLDGRVTASGAGGAGGTTTGATNGNGASGGGSGGMILIDAASFVIGANGSVFANGGGGGEGGGTPSPGNPGANATDPVVAAAGGMGGTASGGGGGAGSVGTDLTGNNGKPGGGAAGGGGGAGGAGVIRFVTPPAPGAIVSPPPT